MVPTVPVMSHPARQSHDSGVFSHGRGGAGNMAPEDDYIENEQDVTIPILKGPVYTTGRGGTGNMTLNDPNDPGKARRDQDVIEPVRARSSNDFHGGRGGAGNVANPNVTDAALAQEEKERRRIIEKRPESANHRKIDYRGWADRGKDILFRRRKKT